MSKRNDLLQYIRDNKTWTDNQERLAFDEIDRNRCPLRLCRNGKFIADAIDKLIDDFNMDNDLDDDWYLEYFDDTEDIFWQL